MRGVHGGALSAMKDEKGGRGGSNNEEIDFAYCISYMLFYHIYFCQRSDVLSCHTL